MSAFDSLKEFKEALNKYREDDDYSYNDVCEDYGISNKGTVSNWFKPIIDGEKTTEEVWKKKKTKGRSKKRKPEGEDTIENKEDWEASGGEESGGNGGNKNKILIIWIIVFIVIFIILYSVL